MPRIARVVVPDLPHHVIQRGAGGSVFACPADYRRFLELLGECSGEYGLAILAYCLMPDHVHLVCVPKRRASLAAALKQIDARYARHIGKTRKAKGGLWAGRPQSCVLDRPHAWEAVRYIERCPVRTGCTKHAEQYPYSSAAGHCGCIRDPILSGGLPKRGRVKDWARWLQDGEDEAMVDAIRRGTRTGRPVGNPAFIERIERKTRRKLTSRPVGRPRKEETAKKRR